MSPIAHTDILPIQEKQLLDFLHSNAPSPLPILADNQNLHRVDPKESIKATGIYRNEWEREPLSPIAGA